MKKILIFKNIFCPCIDFYNVSYETYKQLYNMISEEAIKNENIKFTIYIFGFVDIKLKLENFKNNINDNNINIITDISHINYGKYHYLKQMALYCDYDFIFYTDHDIYFNNFNTNIFNDIYKIYNDTTGIIALNQEGDVKHNFIDCKECIIDNHILLEFDNTMSIASGCFIISGKHAKLLEELNIISVYGCDDYHLQTILHKYNKKNYILANNYVYHPYNNNIEYTKLKLKLIIDVFANNINYNTSYIKLTNFFN